MQQTTNLRNLISGFLRNVHAEAGNSIRYVSVVVHGQPEFLDSSRYADHISLPVEDGLRHFSYQNIPVEAPIDNSVTLVVIKKQPVNR